MTARICSFMAAGLDRVRVLVTDGVGDGDGDFWCDAAGVLVQAGDEPAGRG